jgi:hypothetical protein
MENKMHINTKSYIIVTVTGFIYYLSTSNGISFKDQIEEFRIGEDWVMMEEDIDPETELPRSRKVSECYNGNIVQLVPVASGKGIKNKTVWVVNYTNGESEEMSAADFRRRFNKQATVEEYILPSNRSNYDSVTKDCIMRSKYCVKSVTKKALKST